MAQICTTREQSRRLIGLGIKSDTADTFFPINSSFPAWSLGALIGLMPDVLVYEDTEFELSLNNKGIRYANNGLNLILCGGDMENIFENCVGIIVWLVNNGYINTIFER